MSQVIHVFYYTGPYTRTLLPSADALLARLNPLRRQRFDKRAEGPQRALDLATLRVLELSMSLCGFADFRLADVEYPSEAGVSGKPYWRSGRADFSVSHTADMAACAIAASCRVGIDIESKRAVDPRIVARLARPDATILESITAENATERWTQIEAVLKAAGLGIMHGRDIDWRRDAIVLNGAQWWVRAVDCDPRFSVHVATNIAKVVLEITAISSLD